MRLNPFEKAKVPEPEPQDSELASESKEKALKTLKDFESKVNELERKREELKTAMDQGDKKQIGKISKEISVLIKSAKKIQNAIEGKEEEDEISAEYIGKNEDGTEKKETITISLEKTMEDLKSFYEKHGIEPEADFEEKIKNIWQKNAENIKKSIEGFGFKKLLIIPENLPDLKKLDEIMTAGYEKEKGNKTSWWTEAESITETSSDRLVLVHDSIELDDNLLLKETLDKPAQEFIDKGEELNLSDYLILQRKIFEETGKHIDSKRWTWLPGSKSGSRVVDSRWSPDKARVSVYADDPDGSDGYLGCRLSRSFK